MLKNYYEQLGLDSNMALEEIKKRLSELEIIWNQRLLNDPEKAQNMLDSINGAYSVFEDSASRSAYDLELKNENVSSPADDVAVSKAEDFEKQKANLKLFAESEQYDMAKTVLEQILPLEQFDSDKTHEDLYHFAVHTYIECKMYEQALEIANKSILTNPSNAKVYEDKSWALNSYAKYLKKKYPDNIEAYNTQLKSLCSTCEMWLKNVENDDLETAIAKQYLALAYFYSKDYEKAESFAKDACELGGEKDERFATATSIIKDIYADIPADEEELNNYFTEPRYYWDDSMELCRKLHELAVAEGKNYELTTKEYSSLHGHLEDDTLWQKVNDVYGYVLTLDRHIARELRRNVESQYHSPGMPDFGPKQYYNDSSLEKYNMDHMDELLAEFDFSGEWFRSNDGTESTNVVMWIYQHMKYQWAKSSANIQLVRHSRKKGYGFYTFLKKKYAEEKEYIKAYKEAIEKYNTEIEPIKEKIMQEYSQKRAVLNEEMQSKVNDAKMNDEKINQLDDQLHSLNTEYKNLGGWFSGKRKKELLEQIEAAKKEQSSLRSSKQVRQEYERLLLKIDSEEKNAVEEAEQSIREKYPLPQR